MNERKKVLLGVTGCIAAYKSCEIVRELQKRGYDVRAVMTEKATHFVGKATFDALCGHETYIEFFEGDIYIPHISLSEECDIFLIAPCTANVLAKIAHGLADDLLTATALACPRKLLLAPAMNVHMYENPATTHNLDLVRSRGIAIIEPDSGRLACGDVGRGKLASVTDIVDRVDEELSKVHRKALSGKRVLITSGPTREKIDDIRYISNHSSGKMGSALAKAALDAGAEVMIVSGPVSVSYPAGADITWVTSAQEMNEAATAAFDTADIVICTAAVADYAPKTRYTGKLKKGRDDDALEHIDLIPTPDILRNMGEKKHDAQIVVGFAAETDDLIENAQTKLASKNADMIIANDVSHDRVFGKDETHVHVITENDVIDIPQGSKDLVAHRIIDMIASL